MSIKLMMPSNHLILCCPLLLLPSIFPSIRVFYNESVLCNRWPKYWIFSFNISPSNEHPGLISFRMGWLDLLAVSSLSYSIVFLYFFCIDHGGRLSYLSFLFFGTLHLDAYIFPFLLCFSLPVLSELFVRSPQTAICFFAFLFLGEGLDFCLLYNVTNLHP